MKTLSLEELSVSELDDLMEQIKETKLRRRTEDLKAVRAEVYKLLESRGFTLEEVLSGGAKAQVLKKGVRYQHPLKPEITWVCRGKRPDWVAELIAKGMSLIPTAN